MRGAWREGLAGALGLLSRTLERAAAAGTYVAAGLLTFEALQRHAAENWRHFGLTQSGPDVAEGLFGWERRFFARCMTPGERVLIVGCGGGRDLMPLLEQGYRVEGLEPVAACVELARARLAAAGRQAPIEVADITTVTLAASWDVVIFSWLCYSYLPLRARRVAVLRKVRAHLSPGGRILISYALAQPRPHPLPWRLARLAARLSRADWRPEYGDVFVRHADTGRLHYEHRFRPEDIEGEARDADLAVVVHEHEGDGTIALRAGGAA